jgi:pSer/pThr/pTyr-binding forkhead associated (FHA) protein
MGRLRDSTGGAHPLTAAATRIGRQSDNDIVLDDASVSRHHAVIIDTGTSFVITDMKSANGVFIDDQRLRGSATISHGDRIRICDYEFTFELNPPDGQAAGSRESTTIPR